MLCSTSSHLPCAFLIQDYLERDGERERALARDFVNLHTEVERNRWAETMDRTRRIAGNDAGWRGKQAVTYQHFILSPDPADGCDLDTLRSLALEWTREFFGDEDEGGPGALGSYEVAIIYHDDNANGIPHAHVIVNNTDLDTMRRLHVDPKENDMLADRLQEMAAERGLSAFDNSLPKPERVKRGSFVTRAERERIAKGKFCYKQDLRDLVDICRRISRTEEQFVGRMTSMGAGVSAKDDDWLFAHPKNPSYAASGYRLGKAYSRDSILYSMRSDALDGARRPSKAAENVTRHIASYVAEMRAVATVAAWTELSDAAFALRVNDRHGVSSMAGYDRAGRRLLKRISLAERMGDALEAEHARSELDDLARARAIAKGCGLFDGVEDRPPAAPKAAPRASSGSPNAAGARPGTRPGSRSRTARRASIRKPNPPRGANGGRGR